MQAEKERKIRLPESPYTYVRTRVMRTLLIPREEYRKLLKMSLAEISHYLSESGYRKEINELGVKFSGIELIEHALNKNFVHTLEKLKQISPDSYNQVIDAYLLKYDIDNLKTIIRGKRAKLSEEEIKELLLPVGKLTMKRLEVLMKHDSVKEVMKGTHFNLKLQQIDDLSMIETELDHFFYRELLKFSERLPRQGHLFKEFLMSMIHTTNLLTFLRLKKEKLESKEIEKHLFFPEYDFLFNRLLKSKNMEDVPKILKRSKYKDVIDLKELSTESSLIPVEIALVNYTLRKTLLFERQNPLSIYVILAFLFAKEIEINNLKKIIKAKHLGLPMERVEEHLVIS